MWAWASKLDDLLPFDPETIRRIHLRLIGAMHMNPSGRSAGFGCARHRPHLAESRCRRACIVRDGNVVGRGFYTATGVKHAEVLAIEEAG